MKQGEGRSVADRQAVSPPEMQHQRFHISFSHQLSMREHKGEKSFHINLFRYFFILKNGNLDENIPHELELLMSTNSVGEKHNFARK